MDCSPPGSSVHGVLQARILEWVTMPSSRGSSQHRDRIQVSRIAGILYCLGHQGRAEEYIVTCKHMKHVLLLLIRIFMWTIFKVFIFAIVTILLMFYALVFGHEACGILPTWLEIKLTPLSLENEVLTTGRPGKSQDRSHVLQVTSFVSGIAWKFIPVFHCLYFYIPLRLLTRSTPPPFQKNLLKCWFLRIDITDHPYLKEHPEKCR